MNVSLTPKLEELVHQKVASGLYNSASEVIREALRLLEEHDRLRNLRLEDLRRELAIGLEQLEQGQSKPFDDNVVERIRNKGRKTLAAQRRTTPS